MGVRNGFRPNDRCKSPLRIEGRKELEKSMMLPNRKGTNIYSDNGFIAKNNFRGETREKVNTPNNTRGKINTDDSKSVSELEYQESAYLTAKS